MEAALGFKARTALRAVARAADDDHTITADGATSGWEATKDAVGRLVAQIPGVLLENAMNIAAGIEGPPCFSAFLSF